MLSFIFGRITIGPNDHHIFRDWPVRKHIVIMSRQISLRKCPCWFHVLLQIFVVVSGGKVSRDHDAPPVVSVDLRGAHETWRGPHDLREVSRLVRELWLPIVVVADFIIPQVSRYSARNILSFNDNDVFTVLWAPERTDLFATANLFCPKLGSLSQLVRPL